MTDQCPACGNSHTDIHLRVSSEEAASHFLSHDRDPGRYSELVAHIERLWNGRQAELRECKECGFGYCAPYVAGDQDFYRLAYPTTGYPTIKWEFTRTLSALKVANHRVERILEVGAGDGFFLRLLIQENPQPELIVATEYNSSSIDILRAAGIHAVGDDVRADVFDEYKQAFDTIFLFQVVEHMDDLSGLFKRLSALSRPGARIFIAVPNKHRTTFNENHESLIDMPPNHIGRWTREAFKAAANPWGLELVETEVEPFSLTAFAKQDIYYNHRKRAQNRGTLSARMRSINDTRVRKAAELFVMLLRAPLRLPVWLSATKSKEPMGGSLWVHLQKDIG